IYEWAGPYSAHDLSHTLGGAQNLLPIKPHADPRRIQACLGDTFVLKTCRVASDAVCQPTTPIDIHPQFHASQEPCSDHALLRRLEVNHTKTSKPPSSRLLTVREANPQNLHRPKREDSPPPWRSRCQHPRQRVTDG